MKDIKKLLEEYGTLKTMADLANENLSAKRKEIMEAMADAGINSVKSDKWKVAKYETSRLAVNLEELPDEFKQTKVVANTSEINKAIKEGVEMSGVEVKKSTSIRLTEVNNAK